VRHLRTLRTAYGKKHKKRTSTLSGSTNVSPENGHIRASYYLYKTTFNIDSKKFVLLA